MGAVLAPECDRKDSEMSFRPGQNIGAYRIVGQLGSGGMATVYKAYHATLDRYVAIKVMHLAFKGDHGFLSRFQREARVVAKLDHPNIVPVYDYGEYEGSPYLVLRFIEGETLKSRLDRGQLALPEILDIIRPAAEALAYAHQTGILHRDIKPSNVLLAHDQRVYLTDFGLARIVQAGESSLTRDAMVGTPFYISPEQAVGKSELDARTDIYSFGIVIYELFTGRVPFQADTPFAVIHDHIYTPLPMPTEVNPDLPSALERVLLKALAKDPNDRYTSVLGLIDAVEHAVTEVTTIQVPIPEPSVSNLASPETHDAQQGDADLAIEPPAVSAKRSHRKVYILGVLGLAVLCVALTLAAFALRRSGDEGSELDQARSQIEIGVGLAASRDHNSALAAFRDAIKLDPGAAPAYQEAARVLFQLGDMEGAIDQLRQGVEANPDDIDLRLGLARALVGADRWDEAFGELEWLIERAPELAEPHAYLSVHLAINRNDVDGALHHASEALRHDAESPEGHFAMGVVLWKLKDFRQARIEFERARRSPDVSPLLRERIQMFLERMDQPDLPNP